MGNVLYGQKVYHNTLHKRFWKDEKFDQDVRKKLLGIAMDFYRDLDIDVHIHDIILTGSIANYNYTSNSDLDVHIIVDFNDISKEPDLLTNYYAGVKFKWEVEHDISIRGAEVEMYVQDSNAELIAGGVYSLLFDEWTLKPKYNEPTIDTEEVTYKTDQFIKMIDKVEQAFNDNKESAEYMSKIYRYAKKLRKRITGQRKVALEEGGEFSIGNLVFKQLRNLGEIERISNIANEAYDTHYEEDSEDLVQKFLGLELIQPKTPKNNPGSHAKKNFNVVDKHSRQQKRDLPRIIVDMKDGASGRLVNSAEWKQIQDVYNIFDMKPGEVKKLGNTSIGAIMNPRTKRIKLIHTS